MHSYITSAKCYLRIFQFDSARSLLKQILAYEPQNAYAFYLEGKALQGQNNIDMAVAKFEEAQRLAPRNSALGEQINKSLNNLGYGET